jgi:hypothetical protein
MVFSITLRTAALPLSAFSICTTTGIVASLPTRSVLVRNRSRGREPCCRKPTAFARSMTCGKSTFHGCGRDVGALRHVAEVAEVALLDDLR